MKLRNGKVLEIEREEAGDFYRFSASEIIEACRAWERRRGFVAEPRRIDFGKKPNRERDASICQQNGKVCDAGGQR